MAEILTGPEAEHGLSYCRDGSWRLLGLIMRTVVTMQLWTQSVKDLAGPGLANMMLAGLALPLSLSLVKHRLHP